MPFTNFYKLNSRSAFIENTLLTPRHTFSLATGSDPLSVLLPEDGRPREAVDGARQVDAASDGEPRPDGGRSRIMAA